MGPEALVPMLLVFGAFHRPARATPDPCQLQGQVTIEGLKASSHEQSKHRVAFALRHPSDPKGMEASRIPRELPAGSDVLVNGTKPKRWEVPYNFISVDGETAVTQLPRGRRIFRSVCMKSYAAPNHPEQCD